MSTSGPMLQRIKLGKAAIQAPALLRLSLSYQSMSRLPATAVQSPTIQTRYSSSFSNTARQATTKPSASTCTPATNTQNGNAVSTASPFVLSRHGDFNKIQAGRQPFDAESPVTITRTPAPEWKYGSGVNDTKNAKLSHIEIDPSGPGRAMIENYKLLIAGVPRPISFVSTLSADGKRNLAPFSYFQVVDHDPPIFVIGFSGRASRLKDTRRNLLETGECVISIVSEHMIEAVNATSLDVPYGMSEWEIAGFTPDATSTVKPPRVKDAIFSVEGKLLEMKEMSYHGELEKGKSTGALAIIEGTRFWVREDALNETRDGIDLEVLRPLVQLGGISYGRVRETFELPRGRLEDELADKEKGLGRILDDAGMFRSGN